jgi:hypothetical protein
VSAHADVAAPVQKETDYFCLNHERGLGYPSFTPGKKLDRSDQSVRDTLQEVYAPHIEDLRTLLGRSWGWW